MRVLVTGGAGFLGSHLCERLLRDGHDVLAVDNLYTGNKSNFNSYRENPKFEFLRHDITLPLFVEVDAIYNMACPASPVHYQKYPVQTIKTSILGAINMLGLARRLDIPIFQASTSEVYGDPIVTPQREDYWGNVNPIGIRSCYDEGKRASESLFFDYSRQYGLEIRVARIFNTYGPRMNFSDGRVVSNFIYQALNNLPITIYGEGRQTRSFCYVADLIEGIISMMNQNEKVVGPINLGNPNEFTMLQLAQLVLKITNSQSELIFLPLPADDPQQRKPDISTAKSVLNWQASTSLEIGLGLTIEDFSNRMKSE